MRYQRNHIIGFSHDELTKAERTAVKVFLHFVVFIPD